MGIHRSIVLVAEGKTRAGLAMAVRLGALAADGSLLIALQLALTTSQAKQVSVGRG